MPLPMEQELIKVGLCFKPPKDSKDQSTPIHAPINTNPTPFSKLAFERACQLQPAFNLLVLRTIQNRKLLESVCGKLAESDEFVSKLFEIYQKYPQLPKLFFNVNRSDYMVEVDRIFQIELNTISASLAGLSSLLADFFRSKFQSSLLEIPINPASEKIGAAFNRAVRLYEEEFSVEHCAILFIVQEKERNYYDQAHLQSKINSSIPVLRRSLNDPTAFKISNGILTVDDKEIALVYYRAGYSPDEYSTPAYWRSRDILESSRAIKCPDIASHLAGLKKIQQVLTSPELLRETMRNDTEMTNELLSCFAGIYSLDESEEGDRNSQMACIDPEKFVLKPQREGGGNNIYGPQIPTALLSMSTSERSTYILMDRIRPSINTATILRNNEVSEIRAVSELGIYGVIMARTETDSIVLNEEAGWLLRTKPAESDEGGVVSGYSVLDVPNLLSS